MKMDEVSPADAVILNRMMECDLFEPLSTAFRAGYIVAFTCYSYRS